MKIKMIGMILLGGILLEPLYANAYDMVTGTVRMVEARSNGEVTIYINETAVFTQGCYWADRAGISASDPNLKTMAGVAMMAQATGKPMSFRVDGCTAFDTQLWPGQTVPRITRIAVGQ